MQKGAMKRMGYVAIVLLALMLLCLGCASSAGKAGELEGHWVDVNSKTTLDISGDQFTVTYGKWSETFKFRVRTSDDMTYLVNRDKNLHDFGMMTEIRVRDDGSLEASQIVFDTDPHRYRFVREDMLAKELEIQDLSKDAPKTIESKEIRQFSLVFRNYGGSYGLPDEWQSGHYSWEIEQQDGTYKMSFRIMGDSYVAMDFNQEVSEEYVAGLAQLLEDQGVIQYNGYHKKNNVYRPGYYLYVKYASKEHLNIQAEGDAANSCVFDLVPLLEYAALQPLPQNR